jgi:hypothetical protein
MPGSSLPLVPGDDASEWMARRTNVRSMVKREESPRTQIIKRLALFAAS